MRVLPRWKGSKVQSTIPTNIVGYNNGSANSNTNTDIKCTLEDITLQLYGKSLVLSFFILMNAYETT